MIDDKEDILPVVVVPDSDEEGEKGLEEFFEDDLGSLTKKDHGNFGF